ncbi:acid protease [Panus rudis PR-1116 ss-1]|nr:acid protease [Panus rudis PR-1116 ss-1]
MYSLSVASLLLCVAEVTKGIHIPFRVEKRDGDGAGVMTVPFAKSNDSDEFGFQNKDNFAYVGRMYLDDEPFDVVLDTGSSDLWFNFDGKKVDKSSLQDTGLHSSVSYGEGSSANGSVYLGNVTFGDYSFPQQAFIDATGSSAAAKNNREGLLGLSSYLNSAIVGTFIRANKTGSDLFNGLPFLNHMFNLDPTTENFVTFLLSRTAAGDVDGGQLTIGKLIDNLTAVTSEPKLPIHTSGAWITGADAIIVNGQHLNIQSTISDTSIIPAGQMAALLDTGTSLTYVPREFVDTMFKNLPGATYNEEVGGYNIPCDTKMNVSISFSGKEYPIHPIDMVTPLNVDRANKSASCVGSFLAQSGTPFDLLLGDTFLRNVYALYDYGNFTNVNDSIPFVQLLSVTDANQAWAEFDSMNPTRLQTFISSTIAADNEANEESDSVSGNVSTSDDGISSADMAALLRNSWIIVGMLAGVLFLLIVVIIALFRRRHAEPKRTAYKGLGAAYPPSHDDHLPFTHAFPEPKEEEEYKPYADRG